MYNIRQCIECCIDCLDIVVHYKLYEENRGDG